MNLDDLQELLRDKNITINIQRGDNNTQYNGPTQINHNPASRQVEAPRESFWTYHCNDCGYISTRAADFVTLGGYGNRSYLCERCDYKRDLKRREEKLLSSRSVESADPICVTDDAEASRIIEGEYTVMDDCERVEDNRTRPYYDPKVLRRTWALQR